MISPTNFTAGKIPGGLRGCAKNPPNRIPATKNQFQNLLAAFERPSFKNYHKTRGLTIVDYRARAIIPRSHYRPQPQKELENIVTNRFPDRSSSQTVLKTPPGNNQTLNETPPTQPAAVTDRQLIEQNVRKAAAKYNLAPELITAVIRAESNFKIGAVSSAGAQGLMQLMPKTAEALGVEDPFDIEQNIDGGSKYLRKMLDRFGGSVPKALAAYNAGPGTVLKYDGRVPYPETRRYVKRVLQFSGQMS